MQEQKGETGYKTKNSFISIGKRPKFNLKTKKTYLAFLGRISLQKRLTKPEKETTMETVNEQMFFYNRNFAAFDHRPQSGAATIERGKT